MVKKKNCKKGGNFGPHNLWENRPGAFQSSSIIFATLHNAGVRAYDIANPFAPFFFHADDGIRPGTVTGVQTCALPISYAQWLCTGFTINCPESGETVMTDMREIGPTYYFAPPRIFENLLTQVMIRME